MSTTRSSFDQQCIGHKTISHRAAAVPGPEVRRECPNDLIASFAPPRNKSWRRHCTSVYDLTSVDSLTVAQVHNAEYCSYYICVTLSICPFSIFLLYSVSVV